jgi:hypothetical protein
MKRMFLLTMSSLLLHAFSGCKKELEDGGISFSFKGNQSYKYSSLSVMVSTQLNGETLKEASTTHVEDELKITGLTPGTYYWRGRIDYSQPQLFGSYGFDGKIIIEKGKLMHVTLEH